MLKLILLFAFIGIVAPMTDAAKSCSSFSINGSHPAEFNFYRFYDFQYVNNTDTTPSTSNWPKDRAFETSLAQRKNSSDKSWTDELSIRVAYKQPANDKLDSLHYVTDNVFMGSF